MNVECLMFLKNNEKYGSITQLMHFESLWHHKKKKKKKKKGDDFNLN